MFGTEVATSTITTFAGGIFVQTFNAVIYVLQYTWPYILAAAAIWFFYRVAKSAFHGR